MADFVAALVRGLIEFFFQVLVEGIAKLLGWRNFLILLALIAVGVAVFFFGLPSLSA